MNLDIENLEGLAKAATIGDKSATTPIAELIGAMDSFRAATNPAAVLEPIVEIKRWQALSANQADRTEVAVEVGKELRKELDQLKAENESLRKSATRYEWLRNEHTRPGCLPSDPDQAKWLDEYLMCGDKLDAAIDEQLSK